MHPYLLDVLVDPENGSALTFESDQPSGDQEIGAGSLLGGDGTRYEIRDGVARMIPRADSSVSIDEGATQRSFGAKWEQYQDSDKDQLAEFQYRWFDERFGFGDEAQFESFLADRHWILDAGTGPGLCAARCARLSEARVVGMDL